MREGQGINHTNQGCFGMCEKTMVPPLRGRAFCLSANRIHKTIEKKRSYCHLLLLLFSHHSTSFRTTAQRMCVCIYMCVCSLVVLLVRSRPIPQNVLLNLACRSSREVGDNLDLARDLIRRQRFLAQRLQLLNEVVVLVGRCRCRIECYRGVYQLTEQRMRHAVDCRGRHAGMISQHGFHLCVYVFIA